MIFVILPDRSPGNASTRQDNGSSTVEMIRLQQRENGTNVSTNITCIMTRGARMPIGPRLHL